jgi:hypothetical protein
MRQIRTLARDGTALLGAAAVAEVALVRLGRTYRSTAQERAMRLPGDGIVPRPDVVTDRHHRRARGRRLPAPWWFTSAAGSPSFPPTS